MRLLVDTVVGSLGSGQTGGLLRAQGYVFELVWLLWGLMALRHERRICGPQGRAWLEQVDDEAAVGLRKSYESPWFRRLLWSLGLVRLAGGTWALVGLREVSALLSLFVAAVLIAAARLHRQNEELVLEVLDGRALATLPVVPRAHSARRRRRVRRLGYAALGSVAAGTVLLTLGGVVNVGLVQAVGGGLLALAALMGLVLLGANAWVYGDEVPADSSNQ